MIRDLDVEVALILIIGFVHEDASDLLSLLYSQDFSEIEDSLLPVGIFGMWTCRKADGFVACGKVDIEPGYQSMYEVISADIEGEGRGEGEVAGLASIKVECKNGSWVGNHSFDFDCVYKWLSQSCVL